MLSSATISNRQLNYFGVSVGGGGGGQGTIAREPVAAVLWPRTAKVTAWKFGFLWLDGNSVFAFKFKKNQTMSFSWTGIEAQQ